VKKPKKVSAGAWLKGKRRKRHEKTGTFMQSQPLGPVTFPASLKEKRNEKKHFPYMKRGRRGERHDVDTRPKKGGHSYTPK